MVYPTAWNLKGKNQSKECSSRLSGFCFSMYVSNRDFREQPCWSLVLWTEQLLNCLYLLWGEHLSRTGILGSSFAWTCNTPCIWNSKQQAQRLCSAQDTFSAGHCLTFSAYRKDCSYSTELSIKCFGVTCKLADRIGYEMLGSVHNHNSGLKKNLNGVYGSSCLQHPPLYKGRQRKSVERNERHHFLLQNHLLCKWDIFITIKTKLPTRTITLQYKSNRKHAGQFLPGCVSWSRLVVVWESLWCFLRFCFCRSWDSLFLETRNRSVLAQLARNAQKWWITAKPCKARQQVQWNPCFASFASSAYLASWALDLLSSNTDGWNSSVALTSEIRSHWRLWSWALVEFQVQTK